MALAVVTFWDVVWWIIIATFAVLFIWLFIALFADVLGRSDLSGGAKAGWILLFIIFPFLGCLIYLIARPEPTVT